jgi:hypothetical protein
MSLQIAETCWNSLRYMWIRDFFNFFGNKIYLYIFSARNAFNKKKKSLFCLAYTTSLEKGFSSAIPNKLQD